MSVFNSMLKMMGGGKDSGPKTVPACKSGSEAQQGRRSTMEDTHVHFDDVSDKYGFPRDITRAFYGVFDGHGGRHAAELAEVSSSRSSTKKHRKDTARTRTAANRNICTNACSRAASSRKRTSQTTRCWR